MDFYRDHLLSIITYTPLLGALVLLVVPAFKGNDNAVRWFSNVVGVVGFLVSLPLWFWFDRGKDGFQFEEKASWIPSIGVSYYFGVDGVSALLILLTTLLGAISILCSWTAITERVRQFYVFILLLQTGMIGVFCALDMFLFYVFWEVMLVPMYFLIGIWGGARRLYAAIKFFLYTLVGSVVMLLGILALYFHSRKLPGFEATGTFDVTQWYLMGIPADLQFWVFLAFFLGFAIKVPMFPFHTWLPDAHVEAPTAGSVILAGVLLKMGTYGFIRFSLPLLPEATLEAGELLRVEVQGEDAEQHHDRAGERIEEELDRGVQPPRAAPDPDEEVHRDEHHLPEHVEQEHVEGAEDAQHPRLQQQHEDVESAHAVGDRGPRGQDRDEAEERGEEHEQGADAVHREEVVDPDRGDPGRLLDELEALLSPVEPEPEGQAHQEAEEAEAVRHPAHRVLPLPAPEDRQEEDEGAREGRVGDDGEEVLPIEIHAL